MKKFFILLPLLFFGFILSAQNNITGQVTDKSGNSLPGVAVVVKGTNIASMTDLNGKYSISVPDDAKTLVFTMIGMKTQEVEITSNEINIVMQDADIELTEVVVVGYGTVKKSLVTGAISKVSNEEISKGGNLRVNQALQGKTAGVVVSNNSGQPGDNVSVRIRGTGTNGYAEPLYIVDGLPLNSSGLDFLSPSDIESIEVLKDAAAAAIYGARGANGVVLITTKKGKKKEKFHITYDAYYGVQNPWRKLDVLDKDEYIMIINEAAVNAGLSPVFDQATIDTLVYNTDWQDQMFYYNAPKISHVLSFTGGTDVSTYSSSFSYFGQDGIVAKDKSNFERYTYRLNTTRDFGFFQLGSNLNLARLVVRGIAPNDQYSATSLIQAVNAPPIVPVKFDNGAYATPEDFGIAMQEITNPIAMLSYQNSQTSTYKFIGNVYGLFDFGKLTDFLKGLKYRVTYGGEVTYVTYRAYTPVYNLDATHQNPVDKVSNTVDLWARWNFENVVSYDKTIGNHDFTLMAGNTMYKDWHENIGGSKSDVIFDDFGHAYLDNAQDPESALIYGGYAEHTMLSYFGRINYGFRDKYLLTATLRADGSSRFGTENKFGYFPSVSAAWVISAENFMKNIKPISFLKLRASWGQNGNEEIGNFQYTSLISNQSIYYFGIDQIQYNGTQPLAIANPSLRWETSEQTDIGLDLRLFSGMLSFSTDYYIKKTKDWLLTPPAMLLIGNNPPLVNGGDVMNTGVEVEFGYNYTVGDFNFKLNLTGSYNKNEVLSIPNTEQRLVGGQGGHTHNDILYAAPGTPLGVFYAIQTDGIFQNWDEVNAYTNADGNLIQPNAQPGDFKFVDYNNDGIIDDNDRQFLGNPYPDFIGGLNLNIDWKGFDFSMFWYAALGQQVWDATMRYDLNYVNYRASILNRWTGEGTTNVYPRITYSDLNNNFSTPSDFFIKDADYVRLKYISLGYSFPKKIIKNAKLSNLRIYIAAENLFTFTKYDGFEPEIGGSTFSNGIDHGVYPQARTILGGISIGF